MKKSILFALAITLLLGCADDESSSDPILGDWKLMEAQFYGWMGEHSADYSEQDIVYSFQSNGVLKVEGGENAGYPDGEYSYVFEEDHLAGSTGPQILLVKINQSKWTYDLTHGVMTLSMAYVDGPALVFERE